MLLAFEKMEIWVCRNPRGTGMATTKSKYISPGKKLRDHVK